MLTSKGKYGLKAMVHLAGVGEGSSALAVDIAAANAIPKRFLDTILNDLRVAGLLQSKKGRGGGFALARAAHAITVADVVRALDGPLAPIRCVSPNYYRRCEDCADEASCPVRLVMAQVRERIAQVMEASTLADVRRMQAGGVPAASIGLPDGFDDPAGLGIRTTSGGDTCPS